jgi:hypothetical protein
MTADVYATVAEAYERGRYEWQPEFGGTADLWGARAAVDALAGMGDVTDEQIRNALAPVIGVSPNSDAAHALSKPVRALITQARATDQARIAELEARVELWDELLAEWKARAEAAQAAYRDQHAHMDRVVAERDALRATVERVRALCDEAPEAWHATVPVRALRAALADPKGDA